MYRITIHDGEPIVIDSVVDYTILNLYDERILYVEVKNQGSDLGYPIDNVDVDIEYMD